jgi:hypothetical protein
MFLGEEYARRQPPGAARDRYAGLQPGRRHARSGHDGEGHRQSGMCVQRSNSARPAPRPMLGGGSHNSTSRLAGGHRKAEHSYMDEGLRIRELARKAGDLFDLQVDPEKRKLLNWVMGRAVWKDATLTIGFRQPFDMPLNAPAVAEAKAPAAEFQNSEGVTVELFNREKRWHKRSLDRPF